MPELLTSCTFDENGVGIRLAAGARRVVITGNVFVRRPLQLAFDIASAHNEP